MTDIHIPPAALEAGLREYYVVLGMGGTLSDALRAAFVAMMEAWPMKQYRAWDDVLGLGSTLILPLTEQQDDKA